MIVVISWVVQHKEENSDKQSTWGNETIYQKVIHSSPDNFEQLAKKEIDKTIISDQDSVKLFIVTDVTDFIQGMIRNQMKPIIGEV